MIGIIFWITCWAAVHSWRRRLKTRIEQAREFARIHQPRISCGCYLEDGKDPRFCAAHGALLEAMRK